MVLCHLDLAGAVNRCPRGAPAAGLSASLPILLEFPLFETSLSVVLTGSRCVHEPVDCEVPHGQDNLVEGGSAQARVTAVGRELDANESRICIQCGVFKQKHKLKQGYSLTG